MVLTTGDKSSERKPHLLAGQHEPPRGAPPAYNVAQSSTHEGQPLAAPTAYGHPAWIPPVPAPAPSPYHHNMPAQYVHYQATPVVHHHHTYMLPTHTRLRGQPCKRFIHAFLVAIVIWILISLMIRRGHIGFDDWTGLRRPTAPTRSDGRVVACYGHGYTVYSHTSDWEDQPGSGMRRTKSTLKLPLATDDSLFFLTRGNSASGYVIFDEGETAGVTVDVEWDPRLYSLSSGVPLFQVCTLERQEYNTYPTGLGVYMPNWSYGGSRGSRFRVTLTVTLPLGYLKALETDTSNYAHDVRLSDEVVFSRVHLKGSNGAVIAQNLTADSIYISTSNAPIVGSYTASDRLSLTTSNGLIDTSVSVGGPSLLLKTSNAAIKGTARLFEQKAQSRSNREIALKTSNGAIDWTLAAHPMDAPLSLDARTSNSQAHLTLPSTFEGRIIQRSSNSRQPTLDVNVRGKDPNGRGRRYIVTSVSSRKQERTDHVSWGGERVTGRASLTSSNGAVGVVVVDVE